MASETPQRIAQLRQVSADLVLEGRFDLAQYPNRHLAVVAGRGRWYDKLAVALAAADVLAPAGFELVNTMTDANGYAVCAVLRRR